MTDTPDAPDTPPTPTHDEAVETIRRQSEAQVQQIATIGKQREDLARAVGESMAANIATATTKATADCIVNLTAQIQKLETQVEAMHAELAGANAAKTGLQSELTRTLKSSRDKVKAARLEANKVCEEAVQLRAYELAQAEAPLKGMRMLVSSASEGAWFDREGVRPELAQWFAKLQEFAANGDLPAGWRRLGRHLIAPNGDQHFVDSQDEAIELAKSIEADAKASRAEKPATMVDRG